MAIAALIILLRHSSKKQKSNPGLDQELALRQARETQIRALTQDSDGDGLPNWEEAIFHTDPHNPDTDGDGTPDGEEVKEGRDPLKPGPNDFVATSTPALSSADESDTPPSPNLTQRLATALGQQIIAQQLVDPSRSVDPKAIGSQIVSDLPRYAANAPLLSLHDIATTPNESTAAIKAWAEQLAATVQESFRDLTQPEALIVVQAMKNEDYGSLIQLDAYIKAYDAAVTRAKKIPTPVPFARDELQILNAMLQLRDIASSFRNVQKDPVTALSAIRPYFALQENLQTLNQNIQAGLDKRHITF
ncbi:MAG: hypothetical protein HY221_00935 [Candidatus Sungbacteria bacterium]|uniref:Calcium-binding protein n=1 Tax=Candidatus Sungiibacteriota bacterium TaxID=2750080 RepID=A0A932QXY4_9BACT|nr:hypothetical protein [Candidatus Sungbacteria bacterium]